MTVPPALVNRVIFPLHEWFKGKPTHARLRDLEKSQWLAPGALRELQFRRVLRLVQYAYREVPYYTQLLDEHGLSPARIRSLEDFARIPILTRDLVRERFDDLRPRNGPARVQRINSGGSTGVPVSVLVDRDRMAMTDACRLRAHRWFGVDMGAREVCLWGSPIEVSKQDHVRWLRDRLINSRLLSAFHISEPALARYADVVWRYRPEKIFAYASAAYLLARYARERGRRAGPGWPRVVFTTAEPLHEWARRGIEEVFGCPAAEEYGCREVGVIAHECPERGLHVNAEGVFVEVLPGPGALPGESGEVIATSLESWAMPLIRYRPGDVVSGLLTATCACGRGLPRLAGIEGRRSDFLVTPDGRVMHGLAAAYVIRETAAIREAVREFQVVQDQLDHVRVKVVPGAGFSPDIPGAIASGLARLFDHRITVDVEVVSAIDRLASGKHRDVISTVADTYLESIIQTR
ncbi:MAG: phenylacetate--CoA ligase family protein [Candidatus Rokubacteria bacterium]|nr:phenylacetate--CoA ligase family protein [Candidatus Rokubacteria bacterium]